MATMTKTVVMNLDGRAVHTSTVIETSRHQHDCDECHFFGLVERDGRNYDLYFCPTGLDLIARYGPEGDYQSVKKAHINFQLDFSDLRDPLVILANKLKEVILI